MTSNTKRSISYAKVNTIEVKIGSLQKNQSVPVIYNKDSLRFHTPFLKPSTEGLLKTDFPNIRQINTLFDSTNDDAFYNFIEELENRISNEVGKNAKGWFTEKNVGLRSLGKKIDQQGDSEKENIYIGWPINMLQCEFVDENNDTYEGDFDDILVKILVEIPNIWINPNLFGLTVIIKKIMVRNINAKPSNIKYEFGSDSDPEELSIKSFLSDQKEIFPKESPPKISAPKESSSKIPTPIEKTPKEIVPESGHKKKPNKKKIKVELVKNKRSRKKKESTESSSSEESNSSTEENLSDDSDE